MKHLLKTTLNARKRAQLHTKTCTLCESTAYEAAQSPCVSQGVSACRASGAFTRFGMTALALAIAAMALFAVCSFVAPQKAWAADPADKKVEVSNVDQLLDQIAASRMMSYDKDIVLTKDINFNEFDPEGTRLQEIVKAYGSLTFGNKDNPFKGSFDGQGHYIIGLNYKRDFWKPVANTGLFSFTDGAYIHDIHFRDCYIGADYRGGVLVGQAKNTRIESVRMENCTLSVTPANNSVSLITNAGIMGGLIAGELLDSYMYDCTAQGGRVVNNSVVAVSGLGGEGLYLGALVGSAERSQIEYCRVIPTEQYYADRAAADDPKSVSVYADSHKYLTEVYNRYEVAIGAVAGQSVYAGGVVGYIKDVDVVDCFSTAWVHTWVANYVGVGAGNIGYVGGIAAISRSDDTPETKSNIIRSHYASNMESYQYNALAVIPIIQSNVYLSGLLERDWEEDTGIYNSYFKRNDIVGKDSAIKPYPDGYVRAWGDWLGLNYSGGENGPSAQGFGYGPIVDDAKYADRLFWEGEGYDFEGDEDRASVANGEPHINKWIMDEYLGIPVHGDSVKATLDFPGAGDVTMSATKLGKEQTTADPYNFAVQGVTANEESLTFTATLNEDRASEALNMVSSDANKGFRFQGWFRNKDVAVNHIQQGNHKFFDPMVPPEPNGEQVFNNDADKLNLVYRAQNSGTGADEGKAFKDNDLFVAYYQAQVLFHDVGGNVINKADSATEAQPQTEDDWYNHQDVLPVVGEPTADREGGEKAPVADAAKFLGWTTQKNDATNGGWSDVTTSQLNSMKSNGQFFEGGEPIERPMDLYPVYASLGANISVIAEGHELDSTSSDLNVREGVVEATVTPKDGKYELGIRGLNADGTPMAEGELPDGYRFLGWYEVELDEDGNPLYTELPGVVPDASGTIATAYQYKFGRKLSADSPVMIPDNVDLTQKHYYYARFEYRVDYYASAYLAGGIEEWEQPRLYTERWKTYCSKFDKLRGPEFHRETIDHWSLNPMIDGHVEGDDATTLLAQGVVSHYVVNGHNVRNSGHQQFDIVATFDFPNSARIYMSGNPGSGVGGNAFKLEASPTDPAGYEFIGWSWQQDSNEGTSTENPWTTGRHFERPNRYSYEAHMVATVKFVGAAEDGGDKIVSRAYSDYAGDVGFTDGFQKVFMESDSEYEFRYLKYTGGDASEQPNGLKVAIGAAPSDEYMQQKQPDRLFLGWIDKYELAAGTMTPGEYERLYDEGTQTAKVPISKIEPYLVKKDRLCERPMTLYPVYADYSYDTTTNITRGTDLLDPADPSVQPNRNDDGTMTLTLAADVDDATVATYDLVSWTVESPEGTVIDTVRATDAEGNPAAAGTAVSNGNATLKYTINAGSHYVFVANYKAKDVELDVTYHTDAGVTEVVKKKAGDALGKAPAAMFQAKDDALKNAAFVGWTEQKPESGEYLMFNPDAAPAMVDEYTVVERPMELWPVYRVVGTEGDAANVRVDSNIDDEHNDPDNHRRAVVKTATTPQGPQTYVALEADPVDGYKFVGWYKDYADVTVDKDGKVTVTGTLVPGNRVMGDEVFAGNLYTAVYVQQQVYSVVYHFPDGTTSTVEIDEGDNTAFVEQIQPPKLDDDGKPVVGPDGKPVLGDPIDAMVVGGEQTSSIEGALDEKNKAGEARELFKEWQWKKTDGAFVPWGDFSKMPIADNAKTQGNEMHLYPVTYHFSAQEWRADELLPEGGSFVDYKASNLAWYLNPDAKDGEQTVKVAFNPGVLYLSNKLAIQMDEVKYDAGAKDGDPLVGTPEGVNDRLVGLYADFTDVSEEGAKELARATTGTPPWEKGQAVFEFKNDGSLVIEKTAPASASGTTFFFEVEAVTRTESVGDDGATNVIYEPTGKKATASVTVKSADDKAGAVGSVAIDLPWGYYRVTESNWSWQYNSTVKLLMDGFTNENLPADVILVKSHNNNAEAVNVRNDKQWLGGDAFVKNEFGQGATAATDARAGRANLLENPTAEGGN
ncbi:MAG: hypothetical protein Q4D92_05350 [Slackia sp.]|nr:hypothetical protein [Slackia sp.]